MPILKLLLAERRGLVLATAWAALLTGAFGAGLVISVHKVLRSSSPSEVLLAAFMLLALGKLIAGYFAEVMLTRYAQQATADLRRDLIRKLLAIPYRRFEELGSARIHATLTEDVTSLSLTMQYLPSLAINIAVLAGCSAYLLWLSWSGFLVLGACGLLGVLAHRRLSRHAHRHVRLAREEGDRLFRSFRALTLGMKELRLHRERRAAFLEREIDATTERYMDNNVDANARYILAHASTHAVALSLVGAALFLLPGMNGFDSAASEGYTLTCLFMLGPVGGLLKTLPSLARARVAWQKIEQLGLTLSALEVKQATPGDRVITNWDSIRFRGVTHAYYRERGDRPFVVGPIDLELRPGELVFVVGGNGSGKSTLGKLLCGLYESEEGEILLDGERIPEDGLGEYRQLFSTVFSDFFLFEELLGLSRARIESEGGHYLERLQLAHKVEFEGARLSTTELSQGQRKRLALLVAYLEDRPLYLFDEWAADQDPEFKEVFYRELLPELRARGKTVIVITHDDRYFDGADRILKMDNGRILSLESTALAA